MARAARLTIFRCRFRFRRLTSRFTPTNAAEREATRWLISLLQTLVGSPPLPDALQPAGYFVTPCRCLQPTATYPRPGHKRKTDFFAVTLGVVRRCVK